MIVKSASMKILLTCGPGLFREGMRHLLKQLGEDTEVLCADDFTEAGQLTAETERLDLLLFDLDTQVNAAIEPLREFHARFPDLPIIALSGSHERLELHKMLEAGALGFIPKSSEPEAMCSAIKLVLAGGAYLPRQPQNSASASADPDRTAKPNARFDEPNFTQRQFKVLTLLAKGESNKAIARSLGIAEGTVKIHLTSVFRALKVQNRSQAVIAALRLQEITNQQLRDAVHGELPINWLQPFMTRRSFKRGELLFRKGAPSSEMYYVSRGTVRLEEIEVDLEPGNLFGEIGLFAPHYQRTWTARCNTDGELLAITAESAMRAYYQNPRFALYITQLIAERLVADKLRLESA
jgi:two-component system nitrate/nitrite response regulator NarL